MKITDYEKVQTLDSSNIVLIDGNNGTKTILVSDLAKALVKLLSSQDFISGVNLSELTQINTLTADDKLLIGTAEGNKAIGADDSLFAILDAFIPKEQRRMIYRGKNLGAVVTEEQKANIKNGTFKGFFLGDYWTIGSYTWRIVDFDYWYNCGDTAFTTPHLVIMPDKPLYNAQMNETNITTGGYVGSKMYTENLAQAKTLAASAFGSLILTHREHLTNAVSNGYPSAGAWFDSTLELPNEIMMYGSLVFTPAGDGTMIVNRYTTGKTQLALFTVVPKLISNRQTFWLRDVVSSAALAGVGTNGNTHHSDASNPNGVRPVYKLFYFFNLFSQPIKFSSRIDLFRNIRDLMSHHIFDGVLIHAIFFCHRDEMFSAIVRTVFRV